MRIAEVIGTITLCRPHPSLAGARWRLVVPLDAKGLKGDPAGRGEPIGVYDDLGAGLGSRIAVAEGGEASAPFHPATKPIDGYTAALLDRIEIT